MSETAFETRSRHIEEQRSSMMTALQTRFYPDMETAYSFFQTRRFEILPTDAPIAEVLEPDTVRKQRIAEDRPQKVTVPEAWYQPEPGEKEHNRGVEIEIDFERPYYITEKPIIAFLDRFDPAIQNLGFLVGLDSLREIILPPGSTHNTIATVAELINLEHILPEEHTVGLHINVDDIKDPIQALDDVLLLDFMCELGALFDKPYSGYTVTAFARKRLIQAGINKTPLFGYPIVIRNNRIVEFRNLMGDRLEFHTFSKDFETFDLLVKDLSTHTHEGRDEKWIQKRNAAIQLIDAVFIPQWGYSVADYLALVKKFAVYEYEMQTSGTTNQTEEDLLKAAQRLLGSNATLSDIQNACQSFDIKLGRLATAFTADPTLIEEMHRIIEH